MANARQINLGDIGTARYNAPILHRWRSAKGRVRAGLGNAKILEIGDSTTVGSGALGGSGYNAGGREYSEPVQLGRLLNSFHIPCRADGLLGRGERTDYVTFDPRITATNWGQNTDSNTLSGVIGRDLNSTTNGATYDVLPKGQWDRAEVFYAKASTQGTFTLAVDGGATTPVDASGTTGIGRVTINAASVGTHTLNIVKTGTTRARILGWRFWDSTKSEVEIIQAGGSGYQTSNFIKATNAYDALYQITDMAAALLVVNLTINHWNNATDITQYKADLALLATTAQAAGGDVIFKTGVPSDPATRASLAVQKTYVEAMEEVAYANNCGFLNLWARWGSNYATRNALSCYADDLHPSGFGYGDMAQALYELIAA